jgi:hypothetical protein
VSIEKMLGDGGILPRDAALPLQQTGILLGLSVHGSRLLSRQFSPILDEWNYLPATSLPA